MNDTDTGNSGVGGGALAAFRRIGSGISAMAGNPWGNPGGDKKGGGDGGSDGPRNPWTTPPPDKGKARGPSALDELLRRGRGGGNGGGSGGSGGGGGASFGVNPVYLKYGFIAFIILWLLFSMVHFVSAQQAGVVTRLGSYSRTLGPGVNFTLPSPIERVQFEDVLAIRELKIGAVSNEAQNFVLTQDQNIINLGYEVRWRVRDPELYLFQIADQEDTIREVAESAMRATVANFTLTDAIGPRRAMIESDVRRRMQEMLDSYRSGVSIEVIQLQRAVQPNEVTEAFKEVGAAQQDRESTINRARAYEAQVLERARGEAAAFDKIYEQYKLAPEVTKRRMYYETMEQVLAPLDKVIVESNGVTPYLPLPEIRKRAAAAQQLTVETAR
jgi:membrane protease subunit HflK